jgi:hypothetical protein
MSRNNTKKKDARTPSRQTSKRAKSSTKKQSSDPIAGFDQLLEADDSPASVRRFIMEFVASLASFAGMTGKGYEQESLTVRARLALQHVGADAVSIALRVALDTLTLCSPAVSRDTRSDYQRRADQFAAALLHPQCPTSFRTAFEAIYADLFVSKAEWTHPDLVRATYAPMREWLDEANYCGTAEGVDESLLRLMETLLPEEVQEAARQATLGHQEKGGARQ